MTKIAIIEDDAVISQMYLMKFEVEGFEVRMADDGIKGIEMLEDFKPNILLLDLQMPRMNGLEVLTEVRSTDWGKDLPVLILTNLGQEESPSELKELGVSKYIVKAELTPKQVVEQVKKILATA